MKVSQQIQSEREGFALVVTISLMVLLALIAVGLLSLSSISLRSVSQQRDQMEARANARVALQMAIGELQKQTGVDTRVTAPADLTNPAAPRVAGVWRSWEGLNHDTTGRPVRPDYSIKEIDNSSEDARFLSWLVSHSEVDGSGNFTFPAQSPSEETVALLADSSLEATDPQQIHVVPTPLDTSGSFAWWISPENQKARLTPPYQPRSGDVAGLVEMGQSHSAPDLEVFGLDAVAADPEQFVPDNGGGTAGKALSRGTIELMADPANPAEPHRKFHDLSASAVGLLTNTATGGWRKDLSLLTERWDDIYALYPGGRLPLFRISPEAGATTRVPRPTVSDYKPSQSNLYPWSNYSVIIGDERPATLHAAAASWQSLQSFATAYKGFTYSAGDVESPFVWDAISKRGNWSGAATHTDQEFYNYKHKQRLYPQIARFQFMLYAKAIEDPRRLGRNPTRYQLVMNYVPVLTMWNPFNVRLTIDNPGPPTSGVVAGIRRGLPGALAIEPQSRYPNPDSVPGNRFKLISNGNFQYLDVARNWHREYDTYLQQNIDNFNPGGGRAGSWVDMRTMGMNWPTGQITFEPGEVIMFSPNGRIDRRFGGTAFGMEEGYRPETVEGWDFTRAMPGNLTADRRYWFLLRTDKYTQPYRNRDPGVGFSLSYGIATGGSYTQGDIYSGIGDEYHNITSLIDGDLAEEYWPQSEVDEVGYSIGELASGPWIPLFSITAGPRMTIGNGVGTAQNRPTRGVLQSNPFTSMVLADPGSTDPKNHPANGAFDMSYHSLSLGSTITPNLSDSNGFMATGYQSGDGLSRLVMCEIPLRPMASLIELQGWNPRGQNPYPPFQMNLIGNSDATPLIPPNDIVPTTLHPSQIQYNLKHDDAYCANHLLFDDWFVSSIAPQPRTLGGDIAKDMETFYRDVLTGTDRLTNRSYRPIPEDSSLTPTQAGERVQEVVNSPDGWLKVASRLVVDGMFNVNSTSVEAWKALLGNARNRDRLALHGENGIVSTSANNDHPVTRGAIAPDTEAGEFSAVPGHFGNASEYTGFKSLTDEQIDDLAHRIVEQVRLRGPFLSLAEFINRRLADEDELALAGAVQTAINNLDDDPMEALRDPANSLSATTMQEANPNDPKLDGVGYEYEEAAEGSSAYGVPGWIRQADILRPIAPVLSARDDTFTIRAYGEKLDQDGNLRARAWCEAVVRRTRDYCDDADPADAIDSPSSPVNATFGRKYEIMEFRWLSPEEV